MNVSPFVISNIRTLVPVAVGALLTWLATTLHIVVSPSSQAGLVALATGVLASAYYGLVHVVEQKYPKAGVLLGVAKVPVYDPPATGVSVAEALLGTGPAVAAAPVAVGPAAPVTESPVPPSTPPAV